MIRQIIPWRSLSLNEHGGWSLRARLFAYVFVAVINDPSHKALNEFMENGGMVLLTLAFLGRVWSSLYLCGRKSKLIVDVGPYSLTRNPLYLFSFVGAAGLGLLTESFVLFGVIVVAYLVYYHFIINDEEQNLARLFGPEFEAYCTAVPRFFPRWSGYVGVEELTVRPRILLHSMIDSSWFIWVFVVFEIFEAIAEQHGPIVPTLLHLPGDAERVKQMSKRKRRTMKLKPLQRSL